MALKEQITADFKDAMKAGDEVKKSTLRMLIADINRSEIEKRKKEEGLSDEEVEQVIARAVKMRKEAAQSYAEAGRDEQAAKERAEEDVLAAYMPEQMSDENLRALVQKVIQDTGAVGPGEMGRVIGEAVGRAKGGADGSRVRAIAQELLQ